MFWDFILFHKTLTFRERFLGNLRNRELFKITHRLQKMVVYLATGIMSFYCISKLSHDFHKNSNLKIIAREKFRLKSHAVGKDSSSLGDSLILD